MKLNLGLIFGLLASLLGMPVHAAEALETTPVQLREVEQTYSIDGVVEATRQSTVSAQISGRVKAIFFDVGDRVSKGQVILKIDEREANQALAGSKAQLSQAEAALQNARLNYERSKQLFEQKFISQAALDKAKSDYDVARAQAAASEAGAEQSALAQSYTSVIAPYAGVVAARMVELGEMVTVGKPLMTGFDPSQLRVIANVPQDKLKEIGSRPSVTVEIPSLSRWIKAASVTVQPSADIRTHSTQVRVELPSNQANVYPGMFVRTHFVVGKEKKMLVPNSAVVHRSEVVAVYVVDEKNMPHLRQVRLGETNEQNEIEVLAGLNVGERVARDAIKAGMVAAGNRQ
ncbi:efflux RND transporter periplasmic adaptor subunit [Sideroxydans lithotrophicus]|uniref:Efflux transporter, RND family, MFP subunit n=1 Tax=Sideroxydans lithotrophicus (strain ES-1) TaxID=580332 RepID=D5CNE6_SIDLE|nr:efflux RND transporter periplasmic adaptor subunit [Sideroxydans lithotrophicus]ADE12843.1 efflux transporter, RND family, MFP subunit [Sideroxydans lithotrophicus ES-1]